MAAPRRPIYRGRVVDFGIETVVQPDGRVVEVEIARHPGGAVAMPLAEDGRICLLRQFRPPLGDWLWELPAGKIDAGEDPLETARRELAEEAGLLARRWQSLGDLVACPGFSDEILHLFLATELQVVPTRRDEDEHIETHWVPYAEARAWARAGRIRDAKTVAALFRAGEEAG